MEEAAESAYLLSSCYGGHAGSSGTFSDYEQAPAALCHNVR